METSNKILTDKEKQLININKPKLIYRLYEDGTFVRELL
jgi:hypothetical protein